MIKIEKGIPLEGKIHHPGRRKYPFLEMEIGDSVFIEGKSVTCMCGVLRHYRKMGLKFASRTVEGGVRIWRTA